MKSRKKNSNLLTPSERGEVPDIEYDGRTIKCSYNCDGEYSYAISTEMGSIVLKGIFHNGFEIEAGELAPGFYQLVVFNAYRRINYPFQVRENGEG
ncbi:MAG: hypothetical protein ACQERC_09415 [Bacteroidota bacterium]